MSGHTRQLLGPARSRLKRFLHGLTLLLPTDFDASALTGEALDDFRPDLQNEKNRIDQEIRRTRQLNEQWRALIASSSSLDEKRDEETLYNSFMPIGPNVDALLKDALDALQLAKTENTLPPPVSTDASTYGPNPFSALPTAGLNTTIGLNSSQPLSLVNLPKLRIKEFHGDLLQFTPFWNAFFYSVDNQPLPATTKLTYLFSFLRGAAYDSVSGCAITDANYPIVVATLRRRFGKDAVKKALSSKLQSIPAARDRIQDLRHTYEVLEQLLHQPEALGCPTDNYQTMVLLESKLTQRISLELVKSKNASTAPWSCSLLRQSLNQVISNEEEVLRADETFPHEHRQEHHTLSTNHRNRAARGSFDNGNHLGQRGQRGNRQQAHQHRQNQQCSFCQQQHRTMDCGRCNVAPRSPHDFLIPRHSRIRLFAEHKLQWNHFGKKYKLAFSKEEMGFMDLFDVLMRKITAERPDFDGLLAYNDLGGRQIIIRNDADLRGAIHHLKNKLKIYSTVTEKGYMAASDIVRPPTRSQSVPPTTDRPYSPRYSPQDHRSPSSADSQYRSYDRHSSRARSPQPLVQYPHSVSPRSDGGHHQIVEHRAPYPPGYSYSYSQYGPYRSRGYGHPGPLSYGLPPHNFLLSHFLTGGHFPFAFGGHWLGPALAHHQGWNGRGF